MWRLCKNSFWTLGDEPQVPVPCECLSWEKKTVTTVKRAHQRLHLIRMLKKARLKHHPLTQVHRGVVESVLTTGITVWYGNITLAERKSLQRVIKTAERSLVPVSLPWTPYTPNTGKHRASSETLPSSCSVSVGGFRLQPATPQASEHPCSQGSPTQQLLSSHCKTCGTGH